MSGIYIVIHSQYARCILHGSCRRGLAGFHAGARERHDRHALGLEHGVLLELAVAGARRDPDAFAEEYSVSVKFPDVKDLSRESAPESQVQLGLIAKFTQTVNKLFYDHIEDKYPDIRK